VVACLAIGFCLSWGRIELAHRISEKQDVERYRHDLDEIVARQSDLGHLLADPGTRLVRLTAVSDRVPAITATVAWNSENQKGAIFSDDLATEGAHRYGVALVSPSGQTTISFGPTEAGKTVYPLSPQPGNVVAAPGEIVLSVFSGDDGGSSSIVAGGKFAD